MADDTVQRSDIFQQGDKLPSVSSLANVPRPLLEHLMESSPDAVVIIDVESIFRYANPATSKIFGHEPNDMLGQSLTMIMPPELRDAHKQGVARLKHTLKPTMDWRRARLPGVHKSGKSLDLELSFAAISGSDSILFMGIIRDITAQTAAEQALKDEQSRFKAFFDQSHDALLVHNEKGTIIDANARAREIFGRTIEELTGLPIRALHPKSIMMNAPQWDPEYGESKAFSTEMCNHITKAVFPVEIQAQKIRFGDELLIVSAVHDVTRIKRLTEHLHRSERMELLGRLAGGISHDFNNLLSVIIHNAHELRTFSSLSHGDKEIVSDVLSAAEQASALASRLLGLTRTPTSQRRPESVNEIIHQMKRILEHLAGSKNTIHYRLTNTVPKIDVNASQIQQIMTNLVINARDAIKENGDIFIETKADPVNVQIIVRDTGTGIPPEIASRIFEPLFTTKEPGSGTGLGLSTVQSILESHGASIEVSSNLDKGTTFTLCFSRLATPESTPTQTENNESRTRRILVVEDMEPVRTTLIRLLKRQKYDVYGAADGLIASEILTQNDHNHFDMVITDMMMPRMNGSQLCTFIGEKYPHLCVLILSAYSDTMAQHPDPQKLRFLAKPIQPAKLYGVIDELLAQS